MTIGRSDSIATRPRFLVSLAAGAVAAVAAEPAFRGDAGPLSLLLVPRGVTAMTSNAAFSSATFWLPAIPRNGAGFAELTSRSTHSFVDVVLAGCSATNLSRDACEMSEPPGKAPDPRVAPPWRRVPRPDKPDASAPRAAWPCVADCWRFQPGPSPSAGGLLTMSCHISCAVLPELEVSPLTFDAVIRAERPDDRPPPRLPCLDRGAPSPRP